MSRFSDSATVSAPGRICLFGEHQDYLGLPVIAAAINRRARVEAKKNGSGAFRLHFFTDETTVEIDPSKECEYRRERDYLRAGVNVMLREGYRFGEGYDIDIDSDIPEGKGCGSSSAIVVAWIKLLSLIATEGGDLDAQANARLAHRAEVIEFDEPGGVMDHFASAVGGTVFIKTQDKYGAVELPVKPEGCFILGDSGEGKNTEKVLSGARKLAAGGLEHIRKSSPGANWHTIAPAAAKQAVADAPMPLQKAVAATLANREITREATRMFEGMNVDAETLGMLMTEQHEYLSNYLEVSTTKIDEMVLAAMEGGAYGAKINGSGGGGCMFAFAPEDKKESVAEAIESAGGTAIDIRIDGGAQEEME